MCSRDPVALAADADFDRVASHLHRGNLETLAGRIETVLERLTDENVADAFEGVFERRTVPEREIDAVTDFLREQRGRIESEG